MADSGIFRTVDIFSQSQSRYSGITQEQFIHILNLIQADSGKFRTLVYLERNVSRIFMHVKQPQICMSFSNILCNSKIFQTWNKKCLMSVILGFMFEKLLPYLKLAPLN